MTRALVGLLALLALVLSAPAAAAPEQRTSLAEIEDEVMCVSCNVALNVAESPQAYRQKELIRDLAAQGLTKEQIKDRLVDEYGEAVLAMPRREGFGLAAYLVPVGAVVALVATWLLLLPRWRRRGSRSAGTAAAAPPGTTADELRRLDEDLKRF
jgi:cytochrome c-type biogenesis protein CcmH